MKIENPYQQKFWQNKLAIYIILIFILTLLISIFFILQNKLNQEAIIPSQTFFEDKYSQKSNSDQEVIISNSTFFENKYSIKDWQEKYSQIKTLVFEFTPEKLSANLYHPGIERVVYNEFPEDAWIIGFKPEFFGGPPELLHHGTLARPSSPAKFCPDDPLNVLFSASRGMVDGIFPLDYGYKIGQGDEVLNYLMYHNPYDFPRPEVAYKLTIYYIPFDQADLKPIYPIFLDIIGDCILGDYYVQPGEELHSVMEDPHVFQFNGEIVLMGAHLHEYSKFLNFTINDQLVYKFVPEVDVEGGFVKMQPVYAENLKLQPGDKLGMEALYHNTFDQEIDAMAEILMFIHIDED